MAKETGLPLRTFELGASAGLNLYWDRYAYQLGGAGVWGDATSPVKLVAKGDAELGITQISEILHIQGDTLVGPLPADLQLSTTYGVAPGSADVKPATRQFIELLLSTAGRERFRHAGFQ